jgi:ferric iron reductase protein FhuF
VAHRALPPLEDVSLRYCDSGWPDAIALPPDGWEPADSEALAERLDAHLAPLVDLLARHRPARALWRSAGDRLGQAALWCGEALGDRRAAWTLATDALAAPTRLRAPAGFDLADGTPFRRRTGCCLSYRCDGGAICADCPRGR